MLTAHGRYVSLLRQELTARNSSYATLNRLPYVTSYGELPVVVYQQSECGRYHGNFISASYGAILRKSEWRRRLQKARSQGRRSLPAQGKVWRELDSSLSSDALLMNIFCYPGVTRRMGICRILGLESGSLPEFGFRPRIPLVREVTERTEIDMKLGRMLFEAKLTESDFQIRSADLVELYRDFSETFERRQLPRAKDKYVSYQLIRNILAAHALNLDFCTLLDARRPDLVEAWYNIVCRIRSADLRDRCKVLTWQELTVCLPAALQNFLGVKYGIVPGA